MVRKAGVEDRLRLVELPDLPQLFREGKEEPALRIGTKPKPQLFDFRIACLRHQWSEFLLIHCARATGRRDTKATVAGGLRNQRLMDGTAESECLVSGR